MAHTGKIRLEPELVNIAALINDKIALVKYQAANKNITIDIECLAEGMSLMIDPHLMSVVIQNLLTNAIKFTGQNGKITVGCTRTGEEMIISVKDTGMGMSQEHINKLFRHDVQYSSRGTDNETGTGLGLLICRDFVERHGGRIWLESEQGKGTTFFIGLPLVEARVP
jgi:signal transduction histidine kinase